MSTSGEFQGASTHVNGSLTEVQLVDAWLDAGSFTSYGVPVVFVLVAGTDDDGRVVHHGVRVNATSRDDKPLAFEVDVGPFIEALAVAITNG